MLKEANGSLLIAQRTLEVPNIERIGLTDDLRIFFKENWGQAVSIETIKNELLMSTNDEVPVYLCYLREELAGSEVQVYTVYRYGEFFMHEKLDPGETILTVDRQREIAELPEFLRPLMMECLVMNINKDGMRADSLLRPVESRVLESLIKDNDGKECLMRGREAMIEEVWEPEYPFKSGVVHLRRGISNLRTELKKLEKVNDFKIKIESETGVGYQLMVENQC